MKSLTLVSALVLAITLYGCASPNALNYSAETRRQSMADNVLFNDMLNGMGGIGFMDRVFFPDAKTRTISSIEVVKPYDGKSSGEERWTILHDDNTSQSYTVKYKSDGQGGTYFSTSKDK